VSCRLAAWSLTLWIAGSACAAEHQIQPLGDSITQADSEHRSYRYELWKHLVEAGLDFDLVGSVIGTTDGSLGTTHDGLRRHAAVTCP
jgi:hypothetical protein